MRIDLQGKTAVITGAASGIGKAIAQRYVEHGANLLIGDIADERGEITVQELGPKAAFIHCDIGSTEQIQAMVRMAIERYGRIDIMVNNAACNPIKPEERLPSHEFSEKVFRKTIDVDVNGTFCCSKAAAQHMVKQRSGCIVNIGSVSGVVSLRNQIGHVVGKAAVIKMTQAMALELAPYGIRVNCISPGSTVTETTRPLFYGKDAAYKDVAEKLLSFIPAGRPGESEEIADAALFLASDMAAYVNGHNLVVDGGWVTGFMRDF